MKDDAAVLSPGHKPKGSGQGFEPGMVVAKRYRLDRLLGEGGMGVVWAATHTVTRRSVAMKFLRGETHHLSQGLRQRFLREARAASAVLHPNVVTISDVFELDDGTPVMVMDLLVGETLGRKLARETKLTVEQTAAILLPVVSAVGTAHALGIIHRDLKPENIFIVEGAPPGGAVRVLDFGIAKVIEPEGEGDSSGLITDTGAILGTPNYMSPEQALGEQDIDHRCDIWSLGVILYECLTGCRPIQGSGIGQIVKQIVVDGVRPIDELEADLPPAVVHLIGRMLSRKRSRRPPDLNRVVEVLRAYTRIEVPSFGPPEHSGEWLPEADDERETSVERKSGKPPDREGPRVDTAGAQSYSNGDQHRPRRSMFTFVIGAGLVLAGIVAWRIYATRSGESNVADDSVVRGNATPSPAPMSQEASSPSLAIGSAVEPSLATSSKSLSPSSEPKAISVPTTSKGTTRPVHPSSSSPTARPATSGNAILVLPPAAPPSAAPPNRPFPGGLSEKVPF
jgi:serine/threonine protein kinase